ncbi:hypothetical protein T484DRAFT_1607303 [Baffinella frigidus]|nr:hypothetical protein T484DRAFT_1607303 [Cryptophyta sp. CCMP2293]
MDHSPLHPWSGSSMPPLRITEMGSEILQNPLYNKGTAFSYPERDRLRIRGLIPPRRIGWDIQKEKVLKTLRSLSSDLSRNTYLASVQDNNETLFHALLVDNMEYLAPIIYTPTVGEACKQFGYRFRRPRGMYISSEDKGHMHSIVANWPQPRVQVIVVTDGSRILGLGDLGAYGMGIPIGKLALYCAAGGIAPHRVLPVQLDFGTDNEELKKDPFYTGILAPRVKGEAYFELVDEFMDAIRHRFPNVFVQFEDFSSNVAYEILRYYRDDLCSTRAQGRDPVCCFNDDIQGTGAVTLAGVMSGLVSKGETPEALSHQRILVAGAGSAGCGVAMMLAQGMMKQGLTADQAHANFVLMDNIGPLTKSRAASLNHQQSRFCRSDLKEGMSLVEVIKEFKPTLLLGLSATAGIFTQEVCEEMLVHNERPFIFPLSNPTAKAEVTAENAFKWTKGQAIFASGSPFGQVTMEDGTVKNPSQVNPQL